MSKHTPGPWNQHEVMAYTAGFAITSENGSLIARVSKGIGVPCKANAHLIAAAPELLEALKDMGARYGLTDVAREAIAKAEGGVA